MIGTALRRTGQGGFNPGVISWHTAFWASDPGWSNPGDGNAVSSWRDYSGNGHTATQASGSLQPLFRSSVSALNNQPAVEFDGSNDAMATASFTAVPQTLSVVVVFKALTLSNIDFLYDGLADPNRCIVYLNATVTMQFYSGTDVNTGLAMTTNAQLFRATHAGASSVLERNGTSLGTFSTGTNSMTGITLCNRGPGDTGTAGKMQIAFFGLYAGDVSANANWSTFKAGVASTYGLTIA